MIGILRYDIVQSSLYIKFPSLHSYLENIIFQPQKYMYQVLWYIYRYVSISYEKRKIPFIVTEIDVVFIKNCFKFGIKRSSTSTRITYPKSAKICFGEKKLRAFPYYTYFLYSFV